VDCQLAQIQIQIHNTTHNTTHIHIHAENYSNIRNVIRLAGMFWLIENALQVGTVGYPESLQVVRQSDIQLASIASILSWP